MSSALIPLLSGDFLFLSLLIAVRNSSVVISGHHLIDVVVMHIDAALIFILTDFSFSFVLFIVVVIFFCRFLQRHWQSLFET